jgi:hypothetical protein
MSAIAVFYENASATALPPRTVTSIRQKPWGSRGFDEYWGRVGGWNCDRNLNLQEIFVYKTPWFR